MSGPNDWLPAVDDGITGWLRTCTLCGRHENRYYMDIAMLASLAIAFRLCERCRASDPEQTKLATLLERRYRGGGGDGQSEPS